MFGRLLASVVVAAAVVLASTAAAAQRRAIKAEPTLRVSSLFPMGLGAPSLTSESALLLPGEKPPVQTRDDLAALQRQDLIDAWNLRLRKPVAARGQVQLSVYGAGGHAAFRGAGYIHPDHARGRVVPYGETYADRQFHSALTSKGELGLAVDARGPVAEGGAVVSALATVARIFFRAVR